MPICDKNEIFEKKNLNDTKIKKFNQIIYGNHKDNKIIEIYYEAVNSANGKLIYVS